MKLNRRQLLHQASMITLGGCIPTQWIKPQIEVGYLPAHAQGSATPVPTNAPDTPISTATNTPDTPISTATKPPNTPTPTATNAPNLYPTIELRLQAETPMVPINLPQNPTWPSKYAKDLAWNRPTFASSYYEMGYPANCTSGLGAWRSASSTGSWFYVDLGEPTWVHQIITNLFVDANFSPAPTTTFITSMDLNLWQRVIEETNPNNLVNRGQPRYLTLPHDIKTRYVGFYATDWSGGWADLVTFAVIPPN